MLQITLSGHFPRIGRYSGSVVGMTYTAQATALKRFAVALGIMTGSLYFAAWVFSTIGKHLTNSTPVLVVTVLFRAFGAVSIAFVLCVVTGIVGAWLLRHGCYSTPGNLDRFILPSSKKETTQDEKQVTA